MVLYPHVHFTFLGFAFRPRKAKVKSDRCFTSDGGADIYQIAKNCRTSVEMIEKYYASHIKTRLDTAAINIMRKKKVAKNIAKEVRIVA